MKRLTLLCCLALGTIGAYDACYIDPYNSTPYDPVDIALRAIQESIDQLSDRIDLCQEQIKQLIAAQVVQQQGLENLSDSLDEKTRVILIRLYAAMIAELLAGVHQDAGSLTSCAP